MPGMGKENLSRVSGCNAKPFGIAVQMASTGAENAIAIIRSELEQKGMRFVTSLVTLEKEGDNSMIGDKVDRFVAEFQKAVDRG